MDNKNAEKGKKSELLFKNSIKKQTDVLTILKEHFNIKGDFCNFVCPWP